MSFPFGLLDRKKPLFLGFLFALLWTVLVALVCSERLESENESVYEVALNQARAHYQQVTDIRNWNSMQGGVYEKITANNLPNPYMEAPDQNIDTSRGLKLTLVNHAYMTRQIAEIGLERHGVRIHLTSLRPLRPANAPYAWEVPVLESFKKGQKEWAEFARTEDGKESFRYMAPLRTEKSCLRCHQKQGYKEGDIRGGLSVGFPVDALMNAKAGFRRNVSIAFSVIGLMGIGIIVIVTSDSLAKQRLVEQLESLTCSDELTALQNRRGFWTLARLQLKTAERLGCRAFFLFVDLDRLKEINDTYGHKEGDAALKRIACVLASAFRSSDILARFSGDEFVILCLDVAREGSEVIIERLMVHVNHDNSVHSAPYALSISVGCAEFDPADPVSLEQLMVMADKAMYSNKNAKRQRLGSG